MDTKIMEQLEEIFGEEIALVQHDLAVLEALVEEKLQLFGQTHLRHLQSVSLFKSSSYELP